jgi:hypothetical protein
VLFFPEPSLLAVELCFKTPTHFRICDPDDDNSVLIGSKIDPFRTENEDFRIAVCPATFLNDRSSRRQSIDGLFGVFCLHHFVSVQIILNLMTT